MRIILSLLFCGLIVNSATAYLAQSFILNEDILVKMPDGWVSIPKEELKVKETDYPVDIGFQLEDQKRWFTFPYILICNAHSQKLDDSDLMRQETIDNIAKQMEKSETNESKTLVCKEAFYDEEYCTVYLYNLVSFKNGKSFSNMTAMVLTEYGFIRIAAYLDGDQISSFRDTFREISEGMVLDEKIIYKPINELNADIDTMEMDRFQRHFKRNAYIFVFAIGLMFFAGARIKKFLKENKHELRR